MAENKSARALLLHVIDVETEYNSAFAEDLKNVDEMDNCELRDYICDHEIMGYLNDIRCSGEETNLSPTQYSRNYEVDFVAYRIPGPKDIWVGWDYFYGGGKHSDPDAIEWLDTIKELSVTEKEVMIIEKTFSIIK